MTAVLAVDPTAVVLVAELTEVVVAGTVVATEVVVASTAVVTGTAITTGAALQLAIVSEEQSLTNRLLIRPNSL